MTDIETDLMLARAEIATLKADLAALTARAAKAEQGDLHMCSAEIALDALREAEKRSKGCDLCMPVNTMKSMGAYGRKFMYCPMCGKRLEVKHG